MPKWEWESEWESESEWALAFIQLGKERRSSNTMIDWTRFDFDKFFVRHVYSIATLPVEINRLSDLHKCLFHSDEFWFSLSIRVDAMWNERIYNNIVDVKATLIQLVRKLPSISQSIDKTRFSDSVQNVHKMLSFSLFPQLHSSFRFSFTTSIFLWQMWIRNRCAIIQINWNEMEWFFEHVGWTYVDCS